MHVMCGLIRLLVEVEERLGGEEMRLNDSVSDSRWVGGGG